VLGRKREEELLQRGSEKRNGKNKVGQFGTFFISFFIYF